MTPPPTPQRHRAPQPCAAPRTRCDRTEPDRPAAPRAAQRLARAGLGLLALAVLALPFAVAWQHAPRAGDDILEQAPPPPASAVRAVAPARPAAAPVVLAYHDIAPHPRGRYALTPKALDAQLGALAAAGYRTMSTAEFVRFLHGGRAPERAVYLTFDDGTEGLWAHADRILARYRMRAAAFLITGVIGDHHPYYLSWPEVTRMARSGRWDFQDHTRMLHHHGRVDRAGHQASALASRLWLPGEQRPETPGEYRRRIADDLDASLADLTSHGLPRPRLFAYPFSESGRQGASHAGRALRRLLAQRFAAVLSNRVDRPLPPGRRAAAARLVQRIEVTAGTSAASLLERMDIERPLAPADVSDPLHDPGGWRFDDDAAAWARPGALTGTGPHPAHGGYLAASYRPSGSADWRDYRVDVRADRLRGTSNNVGVTVRDGSRHPQTVSLGAHSVRLTERRDGAPRPLSVVTRHLTPSGAHRLSVRVHGGRTEVSVDGHPVIHRTRQWSAAPDGTGGIALSIRDDGTGGAWPRFTALTVSGARPQPAGEPGAAHRPG